MTEIIEDQILYTFLNIKYICLSIFIYIYICTYTLP